jgi:hypothetical protein
MASLVHLRVVSGPRPGRTVLARDREGRPTVNACGADLTPYDCLRQDFAANVACSLDWARGAGLELCAVCVRIFKGEDHGNNQAVYAGRV